MSWARLVELIRAEVGDAAAKRIEDRARIELGGVRITISKRPILTIEIIETTAPGKPQEAAKVLGVHKTTIYRRLKRTRFVR